METLRNENPIPFDVDGTIVLDNFGRWASKHPDLLDIEINGITRTVMPAKENIELLKKLKGEGKFIILWSQTGVQWAHNVAHALKLTEYVDLCMVKPMGYIDNYPAHMWMERMFIEPAILKTTLVKEEPINPLFEPLNLYQPLTDSAEGVTLCQGVVGDNITLWTSKPHCPCGSHESAVKGDKQVCIKCGKDKDIPRF